MPDAIRSRNFVVDREGILAKIPAMSHVVIEIGCGPRRSIPNAISVDLVDMAGVDIVADVNAGLHFLDDESVDEVHAYHFLEHLNDLGFFMSEVSRVLKPNGKLQGTVPYFANPYYYSDYTHKTPFGLYSFSYFSEHQIFNRKVPAFYNDLDFRVREIELGFKSPFVWRNRIKSLLGSLFNMNNYMKELYEENFAYIFPAYEISFKLEKVV